MKGGDHMGRILTAIFFFSMFYSISWAAEEVNQCVACHQTFERKSLLGREYQEWASSIHARKKVGCEACHRGDPKARDEAKAHVDVIPPKEVSSSVYFKNIPETCGKCHVDEYRNFKRSHHYEDLVIRGRGPTCVTCHGSRATYVLTPFKLRTVCSKCHNVKEDIDPEVPILAQNIYYKIFFTEEYQSLLETLSKKVKLDYEVHKKIRKLKIQLKRARKGWHTFYLPDMEKEVDKAIAIIDEIKKSLSRSAGKMTLCLLIFGHQPAKNKKIPIH